jgi:toxin-antitoxin system PIN domain toxin
VIIPDVNLLLYATISSFPEHDRARQWLEAIMNGTEPVGLTSPAVFGFMRIATNPRVESWLARAHVRYLAPGANHLQIAFELLRELGAARDLTTDVQLATYAIENDGTIHSSDADFRRLRARWVDPLRP